MEKCYYTHMQALLPEIKAVPAEGKTQREIIQQQRILFMYGSACGPTPHWAKYKRRRSVRQLFPL